MASKKSKAIAKSKGGKIKEVKPNGFFLWWGWRWIFLVSCVIVGLRFVDTRPVLPMGVNLSKITLPIASYSEMRGQQITGRTVILSAMPRFSVPFVIKNKKFYKCIILGPAVVAWDNNIVIGQCAFNGHDIESCLLETKSKYNDSAILLDNCEFLQCDFGGISFIGDSNTLDVIRKTISNESVKYIYSDPP